MQCTVLTLQQYNVVPLQQYIMLRNCSSTMLCHSIYPVVWQVVLLLLDIRPLFVVPGTTVPL